MKPGVIDIRDEFADRLQYRKFITDKTGCKTIEIVGASFIADEPTIFGDVNKRYVERELAWYKSQSLRVDAIPGGIPPIWIKCASKTGFINSNYGWVIWHPDNYAQFQHAVGELRKNPDSRRAVMIYNRPSMWYDYNLDGMSDFMCTNAVQYLLRDGKLDVVVQMRSNDCWAGFRNDLAWQDYVQDLVCLEIGAQKGQIHWNAGSLHVYERNFYLVDWYGNTGSHHVTKELYAKKYPDSPWVEKATNE